MMEKWHVTHFVTVEVEAENADMAARQLSIVPSMAEYEKCGKVIRTHWSIEHQPTLEATSGQQG